jgi:threonyl-tRNA synthetase
VQCKIISVSPEANQYAHSVADWLFANGLRIEVDLRDDYISEKIRRAQHEKCPVMALLGKQEMRNEKISLRWRDGSRENSLDRDVFLSGLHRKELVRSFEMGRSMGCGQARKTMALSLALKETAAAVSAR